MDPRDVRFEERATPKIVQPTDAIIQLAATCICGSDLWPYRGISPIDEPTPMGHEYCGIVEEVGSAVTSVKRGQFVIGSFFASDNTCPHCQAGYQSSCQHRELVGGAQAPLLRVPLADGTLVADARMSPPADLIPSLLALSDVLGTGWFAAEAANVKPGATVAVVGDGAVGLLGCAVGEADGRGADHRDEPARAAAEARPRVRRDRHRGRARRRRRGAHQGADQRHRRRRGARMRRHAGVDDAGDRLHASGRVRRLCRRSARRRAGRQQLFFRHVHLHGGPAPVRRYLPELIDLVFSGKINPGKVFDLTLPLEQVAEGYRAMDERRAIKALLRL